MNTEISKRIDIDSFKKLFSIPNSDYSSVVNLTDAFGFSVRRNYPNTLDYQPIIDNNGNVDNVAVIWVVIDNINTENFIVPIKIRICKVSLSKIENPFQDIDALDDSNQKYIPVDLIFKNEFFINLNHNIITTNKKNDPIDFNGKQCLDYVFNQHCLTAHKFYSIEIKTKKFLVDFVIRLIDFFQFLILLIIKYIIGVEVQFTSSVFGPIKPNDPLVKNPFSNINLNIELIPRNKEKIFGFEFDKHTICIFAFFVIISHYISYKYNIFCKYLLSVGSNNFLFLFHLFIGLVFLEFILNILKNPDGFTLYYLKSMRKKLSNFKFKLLIMELSPFKIMNAIGNFFGVKQNI